MRDRVRKKPYTPLPVVAARNPRYLLSAVYRAATTGSGVYGAFFPSLSMRTGQHCCTFVKEIRLW
jgi:hypothetical protein